MQIFIPTVFGSRGESCQLAPEASLDGAEARLRDFPAETSPAATRILERQIANGSDLDCNIQVLELDSSSFPLCRVRRILREIIDSEIYDFGRIDDGEFRARAMDAVQDLDAKPASNRWTLYKLTPDGRLFSNGWFSSE